MESQVNKIQKPKSIARLIIEMAECNHSTAYKYVELFKAEHKHISVTINQTEGGSKSQILSSPQDVETLRGWVAYQQSQGKLAKVKPKKNRIKNKPKNIAPVQLSIPVLNKDDMNELTVVRNMARCAKFLRNNGWDVSITIREPAKEI